MRSKKRSNDRLLFLALALVYVSLFAWNSLTRIRSFSPDSMNYVDVARNVAAGRGLVQSAMGYNHPRFLAEQQWPAPFTAQPPAFPLLIAALARVGVDPADGALWLPALAHAAILGLAAWLALRLRGAAAAYLVVAALAWYLPLRSSCGRAWSEGLALVPVLLLLAGLTPPAGARQSSPARWFCLGLLCGAGFATRYALLPLVGVAALFVWPAAQGRAWRQLAGLFLGFALPAGAVLAHNLVVSGRAMPLHSPSTQPLLSVCGDLLRVLLGLPEGQVVGPVEVLAAGGLLALAALWLARRAKGVPAPWLPALLWTAGYLAFIVVQRTRIHFDEISPRLLLPALVPGVVLLAYPLARLIPARWAAWACALAVGGAALREGKFLAAYPPANLEYRIARSPRLAWVREHTTDRDVIVGNDPLDVVFYLRRTQAISFSPRPYTDAAQYDALVGFLDRFADRHERAYLVFRDFNGGKAAAIQEQFGPFLADLVAGRTEAYPRLRPVGVFGDTHVFEIGDPPPRR